MSEARTPHYIRGKSSVVTVLHGSIVNPIDHRAVYPPLCNVLFRVRDVFGGSSDDTLSIDLHEDWLHARRPLAMSRLWTDLLSVSMSALGSQSEHAPQKVMSALPPKAGICSALAHVRLGHKRTFRTIAALRRAAAPSAYWHCT
jgi:hypothetical protein